MKQNKHLLAILIVFNFLFIPNSSKAQDNNENVKLSMSGHILKSTNNNKKYQLYVSLPSDYNPIDTKRYPVLYILDANYSYPLINSLHSLLDSGQEIEKIINRIKSCLYLLLPYPSTILLFTDFIERLICCASSNCSNLGS